MNYQDPPLHGQAKNVTYDESAAEKDARLQADPELASSEGRATLPAIAVYFTAMVFIVCVVLWGLNHQRDETVTNASTPAAEAPANDAGQVPQQGNANQPQGQNNQQGQANAPAKQPQGQNPPPKQQSQDQQPPAQPQQNQPVNAQQNAPAPKQQ